MSLVRLPPSLRSLMGSYLPADAIEIPLGDGTCALAWEPRGHPSPRTVAFHRLHGEMPRMVLADRDFRDATEWLPGWPGLVSASPDIVASNSFHHSGASPRAIQFFAASLEGPGAAAAAAFLAEGHVRDDRNLWEWLADPLQGPSAIVFCREHPWLANEVAHSDLIRDGLVRGDVEAMARLGATLAAQPMMDICGDDDIDTAGAQRVVDVLRGFRLPKGWLGKRLNFFVHAITELPRDTWPAPIPPGRAGDASAQADTAAFFMASPLAASLATHGSRPLRQTLGLRGRRWSEYLSALHARCGLPPVEGPDPVDTAARQGAAVTTCIEDMVHAFAREVLAPALVASGAEASRAEWELRTAALRLLLGRRTLPRLCEVSGAWHRRQASIAGFLQDLRGEDGSAGPTLFPDLDLDGPLYATCLRTPEELSSEGASRPDAYGADGLSHCVASYAERVLSGVTAILSIRRRLPGGGYERLSTVQVDYRTAPVPAVGQHFGRRNAPPPPEAVEALPRLLEATAEGARRALSAHRPVQRRPVAQVIHEAGAWDDVRDLWSFALTRPQRAMGPEEFVAAMGSA